MSCWFAEAVERVNKQQDGLRRYVEHAGLHMSADGTGDELIKLAGWDPKTKYEFMHVPSDGFMNEIEGEQEALMDWVPKDFTTEELEQIQSAIEMMEENDATGIDVKVHMDMLAIRHDEVVSPGELEKSGDVPDLPATQKHAPRCPEITKKGLINTMIMYDWDSGWEAGEIVGVSGRGQDRMCCIEFPEGGKHSIVLGSSDYCQVGAYERGRWFQLISK